MSTLNTRKTHYACSGYFVQRTFPMELTSSEQTRPATPPSQPFAKLRPTVVFDTYWRFATERQEIFLRRAAGASCPWTDDPVLRQFRFTNVYRASDRVSQYLIRQVIYKGEQSPHEVFFRTLLFKLFNKIATWELLVRHFGLPTWSDFSIESYGRVLLRAIESGEAIYSGAYIMPSGPKDACHNRKHDFHLSLLSRMMTDQLPGRIVEAGSLQGAYNLLLKYPSIGSFLAYQFAVDLNYSSLMQADEMEFVVPGPGALDGISKCFGAVEDVTSAEIIRMVAEHQSSEFERLGLKFRSLWGRPLQLIDCQNIFCEISKYARVRHPEVKGVANRTRIKQKYRPTKAPLKYWFPPKWNLNDVIEPGARADG